MKLNVYPANTEGTKYFMNALVAAFNEYFEVISVDSPELLQEVFRLRHQALCVQRQFPDFEASNFPEGMEKDNDDENSIHILLRHRSSGKFVGTARLILFNPLYPNKPFPIEAHTKFDHALIDIRKLSRRHTAEISRFTILNRFPHRNNKHRGSMIGTNADISSTNHRRRFPHPMLGLIVGVIRMCAEHNVIQLFAVMDPALNRLLGHYGLHLDPIGPPVNYHGLRQPYYVDLIKVLNRMYAHHREVWELVTDSGKAWPQALERRGANRHSPQQTDRTLRMSVK